MKLTSADVSLAFDIKAAADRLHMQVTAAQAKAIHKLAERAMALGWDGVATLLHDATTGGFHEVARVQVDLWEAALVIVEPAAAA